MLLLDNLIENWLFSEKNAGFWIYKKNYERLCIFSS